MNILLVPLPQLPSLPHTDHLLVLVKPPHPKLLPETYLFAVATLPLRQPLQLLPKPLVHLLKILLLLPRVHKEQLR